ncbi:hypothetical protein GLOIN_2v1780244 [Rhizophagus clarus]|uniref:Uncharacterized protein n=1 Tax=Rhizophagus clarus TaxID=94130 RepID=A0A8H3L6A3_9GLOM|nr:hypothetical protein GLOIN_2v1780244 [Rhizophagus clarus]
MNHITNTSHHRKNPLLSHQKLAQILKVLLNYLLVNHGRVMPYLPNDIMKRYQFIKNLQHAFPIGIYRYYQGNYLGTVNYIWKIPETEVFNEEQNETSKACMLAKIHEELPYYFTWQMRKNVLNKKILPVVLRMLYFDLTGDASVTSNTISREVEERL